MSEREISGLSQEDLWGEASRLRSAIIDHRRQYQLGQGWTSPADKALWAVLDEEARTACGECGGTLVDHRCVVCGTQHEGGGSDA